MLGGRRHVAQSRIESFLVVMLHEVGDDRLCLQVILAIVVVAFIAFRAMKRSTLPFDCGQQTIAGCLRLPYIVSGKGGNRID